MLLQAKGNAAFAAGNHEEAIKHFTEGIAVDPSNHVLYSNRSASYVSSKPPPRNVTDAVLFQCVSSAAHTVPDLQASLEQYDEALTDAEKVTGIPIESAANPQIFTSLHFL